ncbi:MAG: protein-S-isoprenylcysteine O-methyltransferase [Bosea sp. (in: a-proteobacteria)]
MTIALSKIIWLLLGAGWFGLRIPHDRRSRKTRVARDVMDVREKLRLTISLTGLALVPIAYLLAGALLGEPSIGRRAFVPALGWLGLALAVAALLMFHLTHKALGRNWSVSLQMREGHKLITEGVYARIRHPMYTAFWLMALAQACLLPNWVAGFSGIIGFGALYLLRVGPEEEMMVQTFGEEYRAYMARTGRLTPWF